MPIDKSSRDMNRWLARHVPRRASHPRWMFQTHEWLFRGIKTWPFRYKIRESKEWSRKGHPYRIAIILNQVHLMSKYIHQRIWTIFSQFLHSLLIDLPVGLEVSWRRFDSLCAPHMPWKRHRIRITSPCFLEIALVPGQYHVRMKEPSNKKRNKDIGCRKKLRFASYEITPFPWILPS